MSVIGVILAAFSRIWTKYWEIRSISEYEDFLRSEPNYCLNLPFNPLFRSSSPEVFLGKGVLKIRSNFSGEHPCRSGISVKLLCIFIEIALRHGCSPVNCCIFYEHLYLRTPLDGCFWLLLWHFLTFIMR